MSIEHQYSGPGSDEWRTPNDLWNVLNEQYQFAVDLAATESNSKCLDLFTKEHSFLVHGVSGGSGNAWLNPPFSKAGKFFSKVAELQIPCVAIYRATGMETNNWKPIWKNATWLYIMTRRVNYMLPDGRTPGQVGFTSALIGFGIPSPRVETAKKLKAAGYPGMYFNSWL